MSHSVMSGSRKACEERKGKEERENDKGPLAGQVVREGLSEWVKRVELPWGVRQTLQSEKPQCKGSKARTCPVRPGSCAGPGAK